MSNSLNCADDSFWCAAVAAITLKTLNPFGNGTLVLVSQTPWWS